MADKKTILTAGLLSEGFKKYIEEQYPEELTCLLAKNQQEIDSLLPEADYIAGFNFLNKQPINHLKWIHSFGAGVDGFMNLNIPDECVLTKTKGKMGVRMAEYCLGYILSDIKLSKTFEAQQKQQLWKQIAPPSLSHQSAILFGTGNISRDIAQVLQPLFKNIIGINSSGKNTEFFDLCLSLESFEPEKIDEGAIIINALPATNNTFEVFNQSFFSKLKNVLFINIGRGNAVHEPALIAALNSGNLRGAVLDVFKEEPLPETSPLWNHPKISITPHVSGITRLRDVKDSFKIAYELYKSGKEGDLLVERTKGY